MSTYFTVASSIGVALINTIMKYAFICTFSSAQNIL